MIEVNNLTPQARSLADFIQEMLNTNNYEAVRSVLNEVGRIGLLDEGKHIPEEAEVYKNLMV